MPWEVKIHREIQIIETCYSGYLLPVELNAAVIETADQIRAHGIGRLLGDCTALKGGHSVIDLHYLAAAFASSNLGGTIKEAVLLPKLPGPQEDVKFWEEECAKRGMRVRVFEDRDTAVEWLLEHDDMADKTAEVVC